MTGHIEIPSELIADPSNAGQVAAWDGDEGEFWAANALRFERALPAAYAALLEAAGIGERDHVLDVGCGTGRTTHDAARLAKGGTALGVDLSSQMLAYARETAAAEGLDNAEFRQADVQVYPFESDTFDVVISSMGSMFFGDSIAAFSNLRRAMRSEGRLTLLTWQAVAENEWICEFRAALAVGRDLPLPPPAAPTPFALSDPARVREVLGAAGFADVTLTPVRTAMHFGPNVDEAHEFIDGTTHWLLDGLDDTQRDTAVTNLRASIAAHTSDTGVTYQSATWIIQATKR